MPGEAALVTADGAVFTGEHIGADLDGPTAGELVFNTSMTGYQEILTDPSYAGQIVTFTYPHIGNYGTTRLDDEGPRTFARGVVVRQLSRRASSWRCDGDLAAFLAANRLGGIGGVDTRRLTRLLRTVGSTPAAFGRTDGPGALDLAALRMAARAEPGTSGIDLVSQVTTERPFTIEAGGGPPGRRVVAYDFGMKTSIGQRLSRFAEVTVVPAHTPASEVLALNPDGVFLSNGPGDPKMSPYAIESVAALVGRIPLFGICLGHQILALAIGGDVSKLPFGHHGANHPVQDTTTGRVEITSQNHNFAVVAPSVADAATVTHVNLNDGVCEGISVKGADAFSVQHHPEASPGPHDSGYLFDRFDLLMTESVA